MVGPCVCAYCMCVRTCVRMRAAGRTDFFFFFFFFGYGKSFGEEKRGKRRISIPLIGSGSFYIFFVLFFMFSPQAKKKKRWYSNKITLLIAFCRGGEKKGFFFFTFSTLHYLASKGPSSPGLWVDMRKYVCQLPAPPPPLMLQGQKGSDRLVIWLVVNTDLSLYFGNFSFFFLQRKPFPFSFRISISFFFPFLFYCFVLLFFFARTN